MWGSASWLRSETRVSQESGQTIPTATADVLVAAVDHVVRCTEE
jgi:hypothetical protein